MRRVPGFPEGREGGLVGFGEGLGEVEAAAERGAGRGSRHVDANLAP